MDSTNREEMNNRRRYAAEELFKMQERATMPPVPPFVRTGASDRTSGSPPNGGFPGGNSPNGGFPGGHSQQSGTVNGNSPNFGGQSGSFSENGPQSGEPQRGNSQSSNPQRGNPQRGNRQSAEYQNGNFQSDGFQSGESQSGRHQSNDPNGAFQNGTQNGDHAPNSNGAEFGNAVGGPAVFHEPQKPKKGIGGLLSGDILKLLNVENLELGSDRMLILLMILLLSGENSDNILLFALAYIML